MKIVLHYSGYARAVAIFQSSCLKLAERLWQMRLVFKNVHTVDGFISSLGYETAWTGEVLGSMM